MSDVTFNSPCLGLCNLDHNTNACSKCFRTIDEIEHWNEMTSDQKLHVKKAAQQRSMVAASQKECQTAPKQQECQVPNDKYTMLGY